MSESAYFNNFISLAKDLAPDGKDIKQVGFTSLREGKKRTVAITKPREESAMAQFIHQPPSVYVLTEKGQKAKVIGELKAADSTKKEGEIKLISEGGQVLVVLVPEGMMDDIVRPMWGLKVLVEGYKYRNKIALEKITKYQE